jgi:hypothetical protein
MTTAALALPYFRWRHFLWRHPESWAFALSAGAWLFFIATGATDMATMPEGLHAHAGSAVHRTGAHSSLQPGFLDAWPALALHWSIMIAAMMFPLLIGQIRVVAARSLWSRRNRAMALFLFGYSALWVLYGLAVEASLQLQRLFLPTTITFLIPFSFLMAGLWQLTRQKRLSLVACHLTMPIAPFGWRADFDCWRYGFRTAANCCVSCWALMFACAATRHALWAMLVVTLVSWAERFLHRPRPRWFFRALFAVALLASLPLVAGGWHRW